MRRERERERKEEEKTRKSIYYLSCHFRLCRSTVQKTDLFLISG